MPRVIFECDGCGRQEEGFFVDATAVKPTLWYSRCDQDGTQLACSRDCIDKVAEKSGKTRVVLPF